MQLFFVALLHHYPPNYAILIHLCYIESTMADYSE